ncbi:DUF6194 family protein [Streptomyces sp. uw30]|uniref:DUF6194 family protein n=1 Tax=Streptomyces sp. uw30 TaxID=1828179 RepID=UPI001C9C038A|nr:DUF6194 family protein [Streptomyces sp. uw30]
MHPHSVSRPHDYAATDTGVPHPVYGTLSWICVVNPGYRTTARVIELLRHAHEAARARFARPNDLRSPHGGADSSA